MKKVFISVLLLFLMSGAVSCETNVPDVSALPVISMPPGFEYEKVKDAFLEYLNFEAWCNPSEMPQSAYACTYEVYQENREGMKITSNWIWFRCLTVGGVKGYRCMPVKGDKKNWLDVTKWTGAFYFDNYDKQSLSFDVQYLGTETISIPAVIKPQFADEEGKEEILEKLKSDAKDIYYRYLEKLEQFIKNTESVKIELIISDFSPIQQIKPYVYLIINDETVFKKRIRYEAVYGRYGEKTGYRVDLEEAFFKSNYNQDDDNSHWAFGEFTGAALHFLDTIDQNQLERIKEIAVLDYIYEGE